VLADECEKPYFYALKETLVQEKLHYTIYPPAAKIFAAYDMTPFDTVSVVIL
jgi:uracil-DNA glycosylase